MAVRALFFAGLFVVCWLSVWALFLVFGDYLRTDRIADALESPSASVDLALAALVTLLFSLAVLASSARRSRG
ncbi:MAG: hypothetical protein GEU28_02505 [Dehalococcoidia bacterium]|nr:hypothetical protein [Dehalococcoidia bacterium]